MRAHATTYGRGSVVPRSAPGVAKVPVRTSPVGSSRAGTAARRARGVRGRARRARADDERVSVPAAGDAHDLLERGAIADRDVRVGLVARVLGERRHRVHAVRRLQPPPERVCTYSGAVELGVQGGAARSAPVSRLKSSWMPVKTICSAIAPATATVIPLTARAGPPGSSCSRRTASCHATCLLQPPDRPLDDPRQQRGDADEQRDHADRDPQLADVLRVLGRRGHEREQPEHGQQQPPPEPAAARRLGAAHDAERLGRDPPQRISETSTAAAGHAGADRGARGRLG